MYMSQLTATTAKLCVTEHHGSDRYYYKVEIDFPGTYEGETVQGEMVTTTSDPDPHPVEIKFLNNTGKVSTSGTTSVEVDFWLDDLPWGATESEHISIDVTIIEEDETQISGGGVVHQSQAAEIAKPWPEASSTPFA